MVHKIHRPHLSTVADARAVRTRESLRRALLELLEVKPLDQITIRDITAAAGVGYTTFFRHHPTKETLLDDLAAEQVGRLVGLALPVLDATDTRGACLALCSYFNEHRALWTTLLTGGAAGAIREELMRISREIAAARPPPDSWLPAEVGVIITVSSTVELLAWWLRQEDTFSVEQIAEILDRVVISPTVNKDEAGRKRVPRRT
jgi:AcrR family transcriptional regulator